MKPLILGSGSPRRRALLARLGVDFSVRTSDADEISEGASPREIVEHNARLKCSSVAAEIEEAALVIGADTLVFLDEHVLTKPVDVADARRMLGQLSGRTHQVATGIAVYDTGTDEWAVGAEFTDVCFRELSEDEIAQFVEIVHPLDRAGAYTVDGPGALLVSGYNGCYQNVLGFPLIRLEMLLRELGDTLYQRMEKDKAAFL